MSEISVSGSNVGNAFWQIMGAGDIVQGDEPSYQLCKLILSYHTLGQKLCESPLTIAQSQERILTVGEDAPEEELIAAFREEWEKLGVDEHIHNVGKLSRAYGVSSIAILTANQDQKEPLNLDELWNADIAINVFDPLNTAGSLVLNQQPNDMDFQKVRGITVQGQSYHRSRTVTLMHEKPIYIDYTVSAFGYVGRSVFQRILLPLKSYLQTLITDDMVSLKAGLIIAKQKQPGSPMDQVMSWVAGQKRNLVKEGRTYNVLSIDVSEAIESIDFTNLEGPFTAARKNIIENIATGADMPAIIINQETYAEGFGEGTEDAKRVVQFINTIRIWLRPVYRLFDDVTMRRAWNPAFFKLMQKKYPERYGGREYIEVFYEWKNGFGARWPNLIEEPDSEKAKLAEIRFKSMVAMAEVLLPIVDPENKAKIVQWMADTVNQDKFLFPVALVSLDYEALAAYTPPMQAMGGDTGGEKEPSPAPPFSARDSQARVHRLLGEIGEAVGDLNEARIARQKAHNDARRA
jgi:hypothetical protein